MRQKRRGCGGGVGMEGSPRAMLLRQLSNGSGRLREIASDTFLLRYRPDCDLCIAGPVCSRHGVFRLVDDNRVPSCMRHNPFIRLGYRPSHLTLALCIKSLFQVNNETVNIWSHLLGLCYFTFCQLYDNMYNLPQSNAGWYDHLIFSGSLFCFQACMFFSACFHLFCCMSERANRVWLQLDLMGVSMSLLGVYLSGVYYAFHCFTNWLAVWMLLFGLLSAVALLAPLHPRYLTTRLCNTGLGYYHVFCAAIIAYGVVPTGHWIYLHGGWRSPYILRFLPNVFVVYALAMVAFFFYTSMVPERWIPGWFDFIGWSHQWWHLFIFGAMVWWRSSGLELFVYLKTLNQPCQYLEHSGAHSSIL